MITGTINVPLPLEKANYYNMLEKRDGAMAIVENKYTDADGDERSYFTCPVCGGYVYVGSNYCRKCGQHLDMENIAL